MSSDSTIQVSEETFNEAVLGNTHPVLVAFGADWCGPCYRLAPVLEEVAGDQAERLTIAQLNIEENRSLALRHGVQRIPVLMLFKRGSVVATREGVPSRTQLNEFLGAHLDSDTPSQTSPP